MSNSTFWKSAIVLALIAQSASAQDVFNVIGRGLRNEATGDVIRLVCLEWNEDAYTNQAIPCNTHQFEIMHRDGHRVPLSAPFKHYGELDRRPTERAYIRYLKRASGILVESGSDQDPQIDRVGKMRRTLKRAVKSGVGRYDELEISASTFRNLVYTLSLTNGGSVRSDFETCPDENFYPDPIETHSDYPSVRPAPRLRPASQPPVIGPLGPPRVRGRIPPPGPQLPRPRY